uniref:Uncharacterized protein n=1 Tax=Tanacetum cinerariifolium TaxID=118510 RepID=A0A699JJ88_TANCI|nr:hypothetical protein [Tanacetum cinerariifolium]
MKKIIKGQLKNQFKEQVSRILPRIEESVNATLEAEVLTRSSHSSRTSYAIAADLSEMELKKILIEKMEGNKSIQRSDEQRNLYKALVEAYDADTAILDTYRDSTILKRRREDDDQEGPSAGSNRGCKRQKERGEHASTSTPDKYLANQVNEAVKAVVQLHSDKLREEAHAENEDFINKIDENIKKIIKEQVKIQVKEQVFKILTRMKKSISEQLKAEVLICLSNEAKTSHVVAANLSKLELKKILIDKIENDKSTDRSVQQKTLYKALVDAYESYKDILATYGDTVTLKRRQDDKDDDEKPTAGSNRGSKRRRIRKEPESSSEPIEKSSKSTGKSAQIEEPIHIVKDLEERAHQEFETGFTEDHLVDETTLLPDWFQKPSKPLTLDCDWNKTLPAVHGPIQPWISTLARNQDPHESFNELMDTPLDFSAFVLNRLKVDTLTQELLAGLTFELMKGSCKSLVELEYFFKEVCKATTDQLDWNNPEGKQYPHDLIKPLPLIPNSRGRRVMVCA